MSSTRSAVSCAWAAQAQRSATAAATACRNRECMPMQDTGAVNPPILRAPGPGSPILRAMNESSIALDQRVCERMPDGSAQIRVKAVPGASRDQVAGVLGDRLKVKVAAPPEGGKANKSICALLAKELGVKPAQIEIVSGASSAEKMVRVAARY